MNQNKNPPGNIGELCQIVSIILVLLHIYIYYFPDFAQLGWETQVTDRILEQIIKTGLFANPYYSKGLALLFLFLSVWGGAVRKSHEISAGKNTVIILI